MKVKCFLLGHKEGELNDSGCPICMRCNSHSYYDDWYKSGYLMKPIAYIKWKYSLIVSWYNIKYNNQLPF